MKANETTKEITVIIKANEDGATATANGVKIGWVCSWFNNTFAAVMNFGIRTRKGLAMPELASVDKSAHGFMSYNNAVLWLGDMIQRYFADHGIKATIFTA